MLRLLAPLVVVALATACPFESTPEGTPGEEGRVVFQTAFPEVFTTPLAVGSSFEVVSVAAAPEDTTVVAGATLTSTEPGVVRVLHAGEPLVSPLLADSFAGPADGVTLKDPDAVSAPAEPDVGPTPGATLSRGTVHVLKAGEAYLELRAEDGTLLDRVAVGAERAENLDLLDAKIVGANVDARVPGSFAILQNSNTPLFLAATAECGGALLAVGDAAVPSVEDPAVLEVAPSAEVSGWTFTGLDEGVTEVRFTTPSGLTVRWDVEVVRGAFVDEVRAVPAASNQPSMELWGRAFASGIEVIGVDYTWSASERVTLSRASGPNVIATVQYPEEGQPADERPAIVTASAFGERGDVDIFRQTNADLVGTRVTEEATLDQCTADPPLSCATAPAEGSAGALALAFGALLLARLTSRRRPRRRAAAR